MFATSFWKWGYQTVLKPVLFRLDPEDVHDRAILAGRMFGRSSVARRTLHAMFAYSNAKLSQTILGIHFSNPVGLAAGFDKDADLLDVLPSVGFGFEEIGSVTGERCEGNPKPRLWRLPKSKGLVVYYGLKNAGCEAISKKLSGRTFQFPIGISIAKTNNAQTVSTEEGIADYVKGCRALLSFGDYLTLNISCPNAFGGEPFASPERLEFLLTAVDELSISKPIFIKMPADLTPNQADELVTVIDRHRVQGLILSNLTKDRTRTTINATELTDAMRGGISGKPTTDPSNELLSHLYQTTKGKYVLVGCGGIFSAKDAYEKICFGASILQLITGMIYEGPQLIGEINQGLVEFLERDGFASIADAIGSSHRNLDRQNV